MNVEGHSGNHFLWLQGLPNEQILSRLHETYRPDVIQLRAVQSWTHDFSTSRIGLDSAPRPGSLIDTGFMTDLVALHKCEPFLSQQAIAQRLNIHQKSVSGILAMGPCLIKMDFKWISANG
jgi:DNA-binding CsgD family transcriptional regulator